MSRINVDAILLSAQKNKMNTLELLQSQPAEQLHHNLQYIERNKGLDFVADALIPNGRSIEQTVKLLYEKEENYNPIKVRQIADFVNGFEGLEKIADEQLNNLEFKDLKEARLREVDGFFCSLRFAFVYGLASFVIGISTAAYYDSFGVIGAAALSWPALMWVGFKEGNKLMGDQKPAEAYRSLVRKAGEADEYLQIYNIAEKLDHRRQSE